MRAPAVLTLTMLGLLFGAACESDAEDLDAPLAGLWTSDEATRCDDGQTVENKIGEVRFEQTSFDVTYVPFESYKDYWGTYEFDPATGALRFEVTGGNETPPPTRDLDGFARFEGDTLVLEELSLGSGTLTTELCGHALTRR